MDDLESKKLSMLVASQLYESGNLSLGQVAEVAGFSKRSFAGHLANHKVSIFNFPANDLSNDIINA